MKNFLTSEKAFMGRGWTYPPTFIKSKAVIDGVERDQEGMLLMVQAEEDIQQSLKVLFDTLPGERIMEPAFGCDLREMLFEPMDNSFRAYIEDIISRAILLHEARISLNRIYLNTTRELEGRIDIELDYTVKSTNSRFNFVYPFYKNEGTGISR